MDSYLSRPAFSVDGDAYTWADAHEAAVAGGEWGRHLEETRRAMALASLAPPAEDRVSAAAREFRYARDLVSGDDMRSWLDARAISVAEWMDHVRRRVALELAGDPPPASAETDGPADGPELERAAVVDAICSGLYERTSSRLAGRAALAAAFGELAAEPGAGGNGDGTADAARRVAGVERAFGRVRERLVTPEALAAQVAAHRLEWLAVECRVARFASEPAAREGALCVREDGDRLADVAASARAPLEERRMLLEDAGPLRVPLTGAAPGELLGPLPVDGAYALVEVVAKRLPDLADPLVRRRAEGAVLDGQTAAAVASRVRWG